MCPSVLIRTRAVSDVEVAGMLKEKNSKQYDLAGSPEGQGGCAAGIFFGLVTTNLYC